MLYHIRVAGGVPMGAIRDYADVVVVASGTTNVISCRLLDSAALTGLIAYLTGLGCRILDLHVIEEAPSDTR